METRLAPPAEALPGVRVRVGGVHPQHREAPCPKGKEGKSGSGRGPPHPTPRNISAGQTNPRTHRLDRLGGKRCQQALGGGAGGGVPQRWRAAGGHRGEAVPGGPGYVCPQLPQRQRALRDWRGGCTAQAGCSGALQPRDNSGILATSRALRLPHLLIGDVSVSSLEHSKPVPCLSLDGAADTL